MCLLSGKISSLVDSSKAAKLTKRLYETLEEKRLGPQYDSKRSSGGAETAPPAAKRPAAPADSAAQNGVKKMRWDQPAAAPRPGSTGCGGTCTGGGGGGGRRQGVTHSATGEQWTEK